MKTTSTLTNGIQKFLIIAIVSLISLSAKSEGTQPSDSTGNKIAAISLSAQVNNNRIDLKWTATAATKISNFVIEKSTDGVNFHDAAVVFAFEDGAENINYAYPDKMTNNQTATVYYRICVVAENGNASYSDICTVRTSTQTKNTKN